MIKQASIQEMRKLAEEMFAPILSELHEEVRRARLEAERYQQELIAVNVRLLALEKGAETMRRRLNERSDAVMEQLARVENAAHAARSA